MLDDALLKYLGNSLSNDESCPINPFLIPQFTHHQTIKVLKHHTLGACNSVPDTARGKVSEAFE